MTGFETARLADLERADGWVPIRKALGVRSFGINAWTAHSSGATLVPEHDEQPSRHEELYLVTSGHATFAVGDELLEAPAGTVVFVRDADVRRGAVAAQPETTVVSVGAAPGQVYEPRSWEVSRDVFAMLDAGDPAGAKSILMDALGQYQDRAFLLYNLACAEAQLHETEAALEHLRAALLEHPPLAQSAQHDTDLEHLRTDPRFTQLVAQALG